MILLLRCFISSYKTRPTAESARQWLYSTSGWTGTW